MDSSRSAHVALSEPEVEGVVLGSILVYPEVMPVLGSSFDPDWFADPASRAFADAIQTLHRKGHRITGPTVIAAVSPAMEVDGLTRGQFIAHCMTLAVPLTMLSGSLAVLKDRWARRILAREAQQLARDAVAIDVDPQNAASDILAALDVVTATQGEQVAGSLAESSRDFLERISQRDEQVFRIAREASIETRRVRKVRADHQQDRLRRLFDADKPKPKPKLKGRPRAPSSRR